MRRRDFLASVAATAVASGKPSWKDQVQAKVAKGGSIDVGSDRQLFLDDIWFSRQQDVKLALHPPVPRNVVIQVDHPWEKKNINYSCVLRDGDRYRMWYRAMEEAADGDINWNCYAESGNGIRWEKPALGLVERQGSRSNNIVFSPHDFEGGNPSIIVDPNAGADERYKMILRSRTVDGYVSADGLHWSAVPTNPFLTEGPFDSHNILLWDDERGRYVIYLRGIDYSLSGVFKGGRRAIRRSESVDFGSWSSPELVVLADQRDPDDLHFYTNAALKYDRAPHAYLMFPMILWTGRHYPDAPLPGLSDVHLITSRDGIEWDRRFRQSLIPHGTDERNWVDRNPIVGQGLVPTGADELSIYYSENYRSAATRIRRATWRVDGFVSVKGPYEGWGEFLTPPLSFRGRELRLNYATSGGGAIHVELQKADGKPIPGFTLDECPPLFGDRTDGVVEWTGHRDVAALQDHAVRMRIRMRDADLYAFRFTGG